MNKKLKTAFIFNVIIFALEVFSIGWMMSGINGGALSGSRLAAFRYFTVDSNILMGICALIAAIDEWRVMKGKKDRVSTFSYVMKLVGTVGVTLTMLVTVFFLAPTMGRVYGVLSLFAYSNFFLHLANPILSIIGFLCFEKSRKIAFGHTFTGIIPMILYAIYYTASALSHVKDGMIEPGYDWYGFFFAGVRSAIFVLPIVILVTYGISFVLWKLNRRKVKADE